MGMLVLRPEGRFYRPQTGIVTLGIPIDPLDCSTLLIAGQVDLFPILIGKILDSRAV